MVTEINIEQALDRLRHEGFFVFRSFYTEGECLDIESTLQVKAYDLINSNSLTPSCLGSAIFNTAAISASQAAFHLVTDSCLRRLASEYVNDDVILKCSRSYKIFSSQTVFDWHADNKSPLDSSVDHSHGLVFVMFLEADHDGYFSVASTSRNLSSSGHDTPNLGQINDWNQNNLVHKIKASKGDLLVFSQDVFHRHVIGKGAGKAAFWFQVVGITTGVGERQLLDLSFLKTEPTPSLIKYLSGGSRIAYANPRTSVNTVGFFRLISIQLYTLQRIPSSLAKSSLSFIKSNVSSALKWRLKSLVRPR